MHMHVANALLGLAIDNARIRSVQVYSVLITDINLFVHMQYTMKQMHATNCVCLLFSV